MVDQRSSSHAWPRRLHTSVIAVVVAATATCVAAGISPRGALAATQAGTINLFAGGDSKGDGGPPTKAVVQPVAVAVNSTRHTLYIADQPGNKVRMVIAGADHSIGRTNSSGQLVDTDDVIDTAVGTGADGSALAQNGTAIGDGGPAVIARLSNPSGVAVDSAGNLYIADYQDQRVRFVCETSGGCVLPSGATLPKGDITSIGGTGQATDSGNGGPATNAAMAYPAAVAVDSAGNLLVADSDAGADGSIRFICLHGNNGSTTACTTSASTTPVPKGDITTVAGGNQIGEYGLDSGDGGPATQAVLAFPTALTVDNAGNFYLADYGTDYHYEIRRVDTSGTINKVMTGCSASSFGIAGSLQVSGDGSTLYVGSNSCFTDNSNFVVKITLSTLAETILVGGDGSGGLTGDGGLATAAKSIPYAATLDNAGDIFIAEWAAAGGGIGTYPTRVRMVGGPSSAAPGYINTIAGNGTTNWVGDGEPAAGAGFGSTPGSGPAGVAADDAGNVYIADSGNSAVRFVCQKPATSSCSTTFGNVTGRNIATVAGGNNGSCCEGGDGGPATSANINPGGLAVDGNGNLFIAEGNNIRFVCVQTTTCFTPFGSVASGAISTVAGAVGYGNQGFSGDGGLAPQALLSGAVQLTTDDSGNLYLADRGNNRVRFVCMQLSTCTTPAGQVVSGDIVTIAGNGTQANTGDGGGAVSAALTPQSVALDSSGNLYVSTGATIRDVCVQATRCGTAAGMVPSGNITTIAGNGSICSYSSTNTCGDGGLATKAALDSGYLTVDTAGNLYSGSTVVRVICMQASCPTYRGSKALAQGHIITIAGNGISNTSTGDGGRANKAALSALDGLAVDGANNVFISQGDFNNPYVREVTSPVTLQAYTEPAFASFATEQVGVPGATDTITLTNPTSGAITVNSATGPAKGVVISGADAGDFRLVHGGDHCSGTTLPAGVSCTVQVSYTPLATGNRTATVTFTDSGGPSTTQTTTLVAVAD